MTNPTLSQVIDKVSHAISGVRVVMDDLARLLQELADLNQHEQLAGTPALNVSAQEILALLQKSGLKISDRSGNPIDLKNVDISRFAAGQPASNNTLQDGVKKASAGTLAPSTFEKIAAQRPEPVPVPAPLAQTNDSSPQPMHVQEGMSQADLAATEAALLDSDLVNLKRVTRSAFSRAISADSNGPLTHRADNKDYFNADLMKASKEDLIKSYPVGYYIDHITGTKQYRGESSDGDFVYILNFGNDALEFCYIVVVKIQDNVIVPYSTLAHQHRTMINSKIHGDLSSKVGQARQTGA